MKTVKDFKDAGGVLAVGDKFKPSCNQDWHVRDDDILESFAWRTNTGVKPEFVGEIETEERGGFMDSGLASDYTWRINHANSDVVKWRPRLPKVEDKPKSPYDVEAHVSGKARCEQVDIKPVFTQAMADAGELPEEGSEFLIMVDVDWFERASLLAIRADKAWVEFSGGDCSTYSLSAWSIKPIQTERDKQIEHAIDKMLYGSLAPCNMDAMRDVIALAYDTGLLQTPKNNVT